MSKPVFFQAVLTRLDDSEVLKQTNGVSVKERMDGDEEAKCPECGQNRWWLLPMQGAARREGGKPYMECLNCGYSTHL